MRKPGPTPAQLQSFLECCESKHAMTRPEVYKKLADEAGMSVKGVQRFFANPASNSYRGCPYSVWRLWNLLLLEDLV